MDDVKTIFGMERPCVPVATQCYDLVILLVRSENARLDGKQIYTYREIELQSLAPVIADRF